MARRRTVLGATQHGCGRSRRRRIHVPQARDRAEHAGDQVAAAPPASPSRSTPSTAPPRCSPRRVAEMHRRPVPDPGLRAPARSSPACRRWTRSPTARSSAATPSSYYYRRQGPDLRLRHRDAVRPQRPDAERLAVRAAAATSCSTSSIAPARRPRAAVRQHRQPDGRLVPQGDQDHGRPRGPEDAHRRLRRPGAAASSAWCRSRSPAATSTRRWRRAPSTPPNGSAPTTTRSSASTRSPSSTTIRAGGKAGRHSICSSTRPNGRSCRRSTRRC